MWCLPPFRSTADFIYPVFLLYFQTNATVHKLSLEENGLEGEGMAYLADMLKENYSITHLVS